MGVLALGVVAAALFAPLVKAGFVYDDLWIVVRNPALRHVTPVAFLLDPQTFAAPASELALGNFRPLATLSLALDYAAWGLRPAFFHAENVAWHWLNALLVLALARKWLKSDAAGWLAACVFLVHPAQVETAAWVSQRSNLLCAAGMLGALWLLSAERPLEALAAYAFALLSKEEAVVLPLLVGLCDWLGVITIKPEDRKKAYGALALVTAAYAAARTLIGHPWSQFAPGQASFSADLMLGALSFSVYLGKLCLPLALRPSYDYPAVNAWHIAAAALVLAAYLGAALALAKRSSRTALALLWIPLSLLPVLHLAPLRPFVAERFLYIAVIGAALGAGWLYGRGRAGRISVGLWLAFLAGQTARAVPHWRTERALWASAIESESTNAFAQACYAEELADPAQAEAHYKLALLNDPSDAVRFAATNNLSVVSLKQGKTGQARYWARKALALRPQDPNARYNQARARR